ncbi:MAG: hypothetical protein GF384_03755 [Elusimicrobia bacterium]|nr:hypothetical protein [Elusimicrobiota bacterium]MBD3412025.1 hypothetical protein [Elusimicrobiota bacterium]
MENNRRSIEEELADLTHEIEEFKKEKEKVRAIVGQVGGVPTFNSRIFNMVFALTVILGLIISLITGETIRFAMIEFVIAALSAKIIYMMHLQARVNHLQLWILSSLEWRIDSLIKQVRKK